MLGSDQTVISQGRNGLAHRPAACPELRGKRALGRQEAARRDGAVLKPSSQFICDGAVAGLAVVRGGHPLTVPGTCLTKCQLSDLFRRLDNSSTCRYVSWCAAGVTARIRSGFASALVAPDARRPVGPVAVAARTSWLGDTRPVRRRTVRRAFHPGRWPAAFPRGWPPVPAYLWRCDVRLPSSTPLALVLVVSETPICPEYQQQRSVKSSRGFYDPLAKVVRGRHP